MTNTAPRLITLRDATVEDCLRIWEWRNEPLTRESSFDTSCIPYQDHERWFLLKLRDQGTEILIATNADSRAVGYVRFSIINDQAEISVSVDRCERGQGYGSAVIRVGSDRVLRNNTVKRIVAYVKNDNPLSLATFKRAGFILSGNSEVSGVPACTLVYPSP